MIRKQKISHAIYFIFHFSIQLIVIPVLLKNFELACENKEYLTWDPELRYIYSLALLDSLRRLEILEFIKLLLDTPTWPPLRNLLHVVLFGVFGHSPLLDVYLSLGEFLVLDSILTFIALGFGKTYQDKWTNFLLVKFLYLSPTLLLYSFSGMLEIQGGLFLTLTTLYFSVIFSMRKTLPRLTTFFGFSFLSLYLTKYPYGYMFLISSGALLIFYEKQVFLKLLERYRKNPLIFHIPLILAFIFLLVYTFIPKVYLTRKLPQYFKFSIGLLLFLEALIFFVKEKNLIQKLNPKLFSYLTWTFLPVGVWTFSHSDRFGSSNSTINHIQAEGELIGKIVSKNFEYYTFFCRILFKEIWIKQELGIFLGSMLLAVFLMKLKSVFYSKKITASFWIMLLFLLQIIQLTFLTPNHQARHVYHLIPLLFLSFIFVIRELKSKVLKLLSFLLVVSVWLFILKDLPKYFQTTNLCFSGKGNFYAPINELKIHLNNLINHDVFLVNQIEEGHLHRMNLEYWVARTAYDKNLKYYKKKPNNKNFIVIV
ncbi:MAG: hypothetical protein N3A69_05900, partial [Leptospiraceae bacterium]|nr:hypothetical protein [Leptospiraceae bacterium]